MRWVTHQVGALGAAIWLQLPLAGLAALTLSLAAGPALPARAEAPQTAVCQAVSEAPR